ncbi:GAK system CofD-like protein [Marinobacterium stanieri]|uniref:CofD-related protein, GAK system n=1 Tax=Marinobacterium stanieri TaxID=49186 RepID=A0A1N6T6Y1_9GAMM|nr:GAK system CofD-like protein [Marinobacterium stanieri]SIQ49165.1 CofD-related protein, GAK system [Marinobacterium stanieri]
MPRILMTRPVSIPDSLKLTRYSKLPELGPRVLFFSGGSALNGLSRTLKRYTHNSIHLVSAFDSGGSSAVLREAFDMPAVGDLRSRLMALADETVLGHPEIVRLFSYRLPKDDDDASLNKQLERLAQGKDPLVRRIPNPMRSLICNHLGYFQQAMPHDFDLRGASIGNLILTGGYLNNNRSLDPIIFLFSQLVNVRGTVRAITGDERQLMARLQDGTRVVGQHLLTGKEVAPISSPVQRLKLVHSQQEPKPEGSKLRKANRKLLASAELICYPPGSFYSSLMANLLVDGVGSSVADNPCPKVYIPNLGSDPEQFGMTPQQQVEALLHYLQADQEDPVAVSRLLNIVLLDSRFLNDVDADFKARLAELDIQLIDMDLTDPHQPEQYDNEKLVSALLSMT